MLAGACSEDARQPGAPLGPGAAAFDAAPAQIPLDPDIVPDDTHYVMYVTQEGSTTIESPVAIIDPVTLQPTHAWTVAHETEPQRVEVGYDRVNRIIHVLDELGPVGDPLVRSVNTTRRTRSVEDAIARFDEHGQLLPEEFVEPLSRGKAGRYEQITDGVALDAAAVDALGAFDALSAAAAPLVRSAGPRAAVERLDAGRLRITNDLSGGAERAAGGVQPERGRYVRTYRRHGAHYLLEHAELSTETRDAKGGVVRTRQVEHVQVVQLHRNTARDAQRAALRERAGTADVPQALDWTGMAGGDDGCPTCIIPPEPPEAPGPPAPSPPECPNVAGGANLLFQHGIMSSGATWERMEAWWIRCAFVTAATARPSIDWRPRIDSQRGELHGKVPVWMHALILIGHSNGGLVSRAYAQRSQQHQPGRVRGVVTLDSPNQGAIIAINTQALETIVGTAVFGPINWLIADLFLWPPFYEDDVPGSAFLTRTNGFPESFTRVGIRTHTRNRWVVYRILNTPDFCTPESSCGERAVARQAQQSYDRHRHYSKFWYRPWQSIPAAASMVWMNCKDALWNGLTAPFGLTTDGFIHGPGQVYPNATRDRPINNGDSHVGTTRSPYVRDELFAALRDPLLFGLQERN